MCECWEFGCGHTTTIECPGYRNRILVFGEDKAAVADDPFTDDAGALPSTPSNRPARAHSTSSGAPPPFDLPSPTTSSAESDHDSTPRVRRESFNGKYGPGPAIESAEISTLPELPVRTIAKVVTCSGPQSKDKTDDECYKCILEKSKNNSTFRRDEEAAEKRLHEELQRTAEESLARERTRYRSHNPRHETAEHHQGGRGNHTVDLGHENPHRGGRHTSYAAAAAAASGTHVPRASFHHRHHHAPHASQQFYPQALNQFPDYTAYPGPGPPYHQTYYPAATAAYGYHNPAQYATTNTNYQYDYPQQANPNHSLLSFEQPYHHPQAQAQAQAVYPQYTFQQTQMEMEVQMQMQYQFPAGEEQVQYDEYGNPVGYGYAYYQAM